MRLVLDTNIIVAGVRSPQGKCASILRLARSGRIKPIVSTSLFLEYEAVLSRPEHLTAAGITRDDVQRFLAAIALLAEPVIPSFRWRPQLSDSDDEHVLDAVLNGFADGLVTYESRTFADAAARFGFRVMTPDTVFAILNQ